MLLQNQKKINNLNTTFSFLTFNLNAFHNENYNLKNPFNWTAKHTVISSEEILNIFDL